MAEEKGIARIEVPAGGPAWWREARERAAARYREMGVPTTRQEEWRFTSLAPLAPIALAPARPAEAGSPRALLDLAPQAEGPRLVFANGRFRPELSSTGALPEGAVLANLGRALEAHPDLVRAHLGRLARAEDHPFVALNAALGEDGALLVLPAGAEIEDPIQVVWITDAPGASAATHPRLLLVAGEGARATVAEIFLGRGDPPYLTNAVAEVALADRARVEHYRIQDEAPGAFHLGSTHVEEGTEARYESHQLVLGSALARSEVRARLSGERGEIALTGLTMTSGRQHHDVLSLVEHAAPGCTTTESYKGILDGHARGVFVGRIRVLPGAQKTSAHQQSSSLLLSEEAVVNTMPQLEIFADDVKCGHGGTVGQLDEDALFYLRSRGLAPETARSLLIYAFASEMVERIRPAALRARVRDLVTARLPAAVRLREAA
ncbi:MAG TPA: Fe-S cluster assembly protein SufD [Anaeromyxobacteraceae bacterium]|nr:Fe-S cluster assembly protein SufD [Anaeromyxobacteraceae bacterium]